MPKEWILNSATNRFQLNFSRSVGSVSEEIRKCSPKKKEEWEAYYFQKVRTKEHLTELGKKLYTKVTEVLHAEISEITEQDCIDYIFGLVIDRTYDGYVTEIKTIYEQLQEILQVPIEPASDEWDRLYNVDFYIEVQGHYIGLQIKPVSNVSHIPQRFKEIKHQTTTHRKFSSKYGGRVFYVYSEKVDRNKCIQNVEVIEEIKEEIIRLRNLDR